MNAERAAMLIKRLEPPAFGDVAEMIAPAVDRPFAGGRCLTWLAGCGSDHVPLGVSGLPPGKNSVRCERRPKQGAGVSHQAVSVGSTAVARAGLRLRRGSGVGSCLLAFASDAGSAATVVAFAATSIPVFCNPMISSSRTTCARALGYGLKGCRSPALTSSLI